MKQQLLGAAVGVTAAFLLASQGIAFEGKSVTAPDCDYGGKIKSIDATDQYAWGENVGWLVWGTPEGDVFVPDSGGGEFTGYVWGENVGWVSLNCSNTSSCGTVDYQVERDSGDVTGYAWGEKVDQELTDVLQEEDADFEATFVYRSMRVIFGFEIGID